MIASCYANGVIVFSRPPVPSDALPIASGNAAQLREVVSAHARRAYDGKTLLVPGLPEAKTWDQRSEALIRFQARVQKDLGRPGLAKRIAAFDAKRQPPWRAA